MDIDEKLRGYQNDPNYKKENEHNEAIIVKRSEQIKIVEHDLIKDWRSRGFPEINFTGDIKRMKEKLNFDQVDFILNWLPKIVNTYGSQEMLVRALILAAKPFDGQVLMELFDDPSSSFNLKWAIGNTIESVKVLNVTQWLKRKFQSLSLGKENEMLVYALGRYLDTDEARSYLIKIFDNYPLQSADTLAKIGNREDLNFLTTKIALYKGLGKGIIKKSINKLEKKLNKKSS